MNKAIQYREDGKFYGFYKPEEPDNEKYGNEMQISLAWHEYKEELKECIAAGKEIINPEVLPIHKQWTGELQKLYLKYHGLLKPGHIVDCPDNIEFEEKESWYSTNTATLNPDKVIRLKLKDKYKCGDCGCEINKGEHDIFGCCDDCYDKCHSKVKPVESQDATKELLLYINDLEIRTADEPLDDDEFIELIKYKFTITRNKNI